MFHASVSSDRYAKVKNGKAESKRCIIYETEHVV